MKTYNLDQNENEYVIRYEYTAGRIDLTIWDVDIADQFPKSLKVFTSKLYGENNSTRISTRIIANLSPDDVNGGKNETGMKRLRRFIEIARTLKPVIFKRSDYNQFSNSILELPAELIK